MLNFVPYHLASGTAFFEGLAIASLGLLLLCRVRKGIPRSVLRIGAAIGIVLVAGSSTPLSIWLYIPWFGLACFCFVRTRLLPAMMLLMLSCTLCTMELRWRVILHAIIAADRPVHVIGDSITAGIGRHEKTWPALLKEWMYLDVRDHSQPGATVESAMIQARQIQNGPATVIVEIGGNDLPGGMKGADFRKQLDALLDDLSRKQQAIVMFELPLLPFKNGYGEAQRTLAAKYHAVLIPKKCFVKIIEKKNFTVDDLHLSQEGQVAMGRLVETVITGESRH